MDRRSPAPAGFGRRLRKEDQRFVRGQGTYVDDVQLPGMLYGAVLRSPHPHARIVSIDTIAAEAHPKVKAVITGETLAATEPGLDAHPVRRHAGRAGHRQGAVPGPGGGVRGRRGPLLGPGRPGTDRRGLRAAARGGRRAPRDGPGAPLIRDDLAGRDRQPHLRLGGRRRRPHRGGVPRRRGNGHPGHALPAGPPGAAGNLRRGRGLRPGERQADDLGHHARPRTRTGPCTRWWRACPSTRSG